MLILGSETAGETIHIVPKKTARGKEEGMVFGFNGYLPLRHATIS